MKRVLAFLLVLSVCFVTASCGLQGSAGDKLNVVCTLFPQYDFVRQIAGDLVENTLLLPIGAESHAYDPTPTDVVRIGEADLFLYIGDAMETWAPALLSETKGKGTTVLNLSEKLGLSLSEHADHDANGVDPHIWTSPVYAMQMVELIRDTLMELDSANASAYAENAGVLLSELQRLDASFRELTENATQKQIVFGSRFALRNFTECYGLTATAAFDSCTEESEPSAATVAKIMKIMQDNKIPILFYEELTVPTTAETIAAEVGAQTRLFHSCHNLTKEEFESGETYVTLMRQNLAYLMEALGGNDTQM